MGVNAEPCQIFSRRLLLVEDNQMLQEILTEYFTLQQFQVILAENGQEAVEKGRSEMPHIIVMDISLPIMDGLQAARELKNASKTHHIPIIALSAYAMAEDKAKGMAAGCDDYETKPVNFSRLMEKIEQLLKER